MQLDLKEMLDGRVLIGDGAMGTVMQERGVGPGAPYVRANLTHPEAVIGIHEEYLRAGSRIIETNTFAANRIKLADHGLEDRVRELNVEGARLAKKAVENAGLTGRAGSKGSRGSGDSGGSERAIVAGAIGPTGQPLVPIGSIEYEEAREIFREAADALIEGGADALLLETFTDMDELRLAYEVASAFDVPVLAYKSFIEDGERLGNGLPVKVAREVSDWGAALVGTNCTVGPQRMVSIVEQMASQIGPVAALPTPGLPQLIDGVVRYSQDADHFAEYGVKLAESGARLIGGCCGTTPDHVRALAQRLEDFEPPREIETNGSVAAAVAAADEAEVTGPREPVTDFWQRLKEGWATTVEVDLPRGNDISEVIEAARKLKERGVHAIDISDGARARLRMHPVTVGRLIQEEVGIEVVSHISTRDRNIIGLQADLLSAHALGVHNILAVTGDPAQIGDFPEATSVFDTDSVGLVHAMSKMNRGEDLAGNPIGEPPGFLIGASFNPTAEDMGYELDKIKRKIDAGTHAFWTQPIFEIESLERALEHFGDLELKIILGLMPLRTARQAEFMEREVPGINVPEHVRETISGLPKEDVPKYGVELAQDILARARPLIDGAYIMPPASAPELAGDVLEAVEGVGNREH
ncbi:bifunctional homocysteine S-methyltransferase/methylenetetrahydrofolate reductase [Rubrobacter aplysinae]|uniref:bifunctional homocysteine S-methyltransferase/methylenetetrahydrofolate reductase n=1 Tax=Rubrobacter aplysinae TaxID=909625 RepID=UPI00069EDFE3|nr:bifunctional homocysteine S-methyltransferase/methylenetetrahydrofolate reductase [Rubrobacter aplysinae]